jgi:hypothetical protein
MRGQKIMGAVVLNMINQTRDQLENWFVREGAPLVRAGIVQLNKNSNGFSVEKRVPPAEDPQKQEFAEVLLRESNLAMQEYIASLEPPRNLASDARTEIQLLRSLTPPSLSTLQLCPHARQFQCQLFSLVHQSRRGGHHHPPCRRASVTASPRQLQCLPIQGQTMVTDVVLLLLLGAALPSALQAHQP